MNTRTRSRRSAPRVDLARPSRAAFGARGVSADLAERFARVFQRALVG
ncbi:MAG: hypothetical protein FJ090_20890 [Deltaproteobacteria bacterium]|nr:hypothetical protein [Deltaproteobacteria bacterium]